VSGANRDDPADDAAPGPAIDPDDDATQAVDLPAGLFDAIADPEAQPLAVSIRSSRRVPAVRGADVAAPDHGEPEDGQPALDEPDAGDQTITEVPLEYAPAAYSKPRHSDERPVPIPLPVSAERPIPRIISRPGQRPPIASAPAVTPAAVRAAPALAAASPNASAARAPASSAPPEPLPVLYTDSRAPIPSRPRPPATLLPPPPVPGVVSRSTAPAPADLEEKTNIFQAQAPGPQLPRGRLTIIEGETPGKNWYLNRARTQIGRGVENDIVLLDINISRQHLRVDRHAQGFRVVDLDSGNGTQLNDRRASREELFDGDRIRLGEHLIEFMTTDAERPRVRDARHTDPNIAVDRGTRPGGKIGIPRSIPRAWIIAWSIATFLAVFGTMYIARTVKIRRAAAASIEEAETALQEADVAQRDREWHRAREALQRARVQKPELTEYATRLSAINAEIRAKKALRLMQLRLKAGELTEARLAYGDVPEASVYHPEATILARRLTQAERDRQVARARVERDAGRANVARQILEKVLAQDPLHAEAKALLGTLPAPVPMPASDGGAPPPVAPTSTLTPPAPPSTKSTSKTQRAPRPKKASHPRATARGVAAKLAAGDAAYRAGKYAAAQTEFAAAAQAARGDDATKAKQKATAAGVLASALPAAQQADRGNQSGRAVTEYERALKADRTLGGRNAGRIRPPLAQHLCREAMKSFMRRQYDRASKLNGRALQLDPNLSQARRLAERIAKMPQ
jgi:pSer/pThr/pTyr-binding forkhead associated (FHA) protein/tetratricopeptide (TPR) repeat protein